MNQARRQTLLVEYQKAQDSAEHHDNQVSSLTGLWIGSAVLIGFVLNGLGSHRLLHHKWLLSFVILVGLSTCLLALVWSSRSGKVKNRKYRRCQDIERQLGMTQHLTETRRRAVGPVRLLVYFAPIVLLAVVWFILLADVIRA